MKIWKRFLGIIIILVLVVVQVLVYSRVVNRKWDEIKYDAFFEQEEDFDVLFLGSSHVLNGVFPMELWNDYGIVSYNLGGHGCTLSMSYWVLKNALDYTTPKLVVIDGYFLGRDIKYITEKEYAHITLDAFPLSRTKIDMVNDLCNKREEKIEFLWEFSLYHNRWSELTEMDFKYEANKEMGAESRIGITQFEVYSSECGECLEGETVGMDYMCKIIELCQSKNIQVLVTYLPFSGDGWKEANSLKLITEKYDVNFINFLEEDIVNDKTDYYDSDSHLNPSGARKVTDYLGRYITEKYSVPNQKENVAYSEKWNEYYKEYVQLKKDNFAAAEINNQLMLMYDDDFNGGIYVTDTERFLEESLHRELLLNLGVDLTLLPNEGWSLIYFDNKTGEINYITENNQAGIELVHKKEHVEIKMNGEICIVIQTDKGEMAYGFWGEKL